MRICFVSTLFHEEFDISVSCAEDELPISKLIDGAINFMRNRCLMLSERTKM